MSYWNYDRNSYNWNGMIPIRKNGVETTTYLYGQILAMMYNPDARLSCGSNDDKTLRKRKTKAEKKDKSYRKLIVLE